ncbi:MAG: hypothetical protein AB9879_03475 [Methanothrix sp.]
MKVLTAFIEGSKDMVEEFSEAARSYKPVGAKVSDISFQEHKGYIIGMSDYMHLLQVEQLGKGIPTLLSIDQKQDRTLEKQNELLDEVRDMNKKFDKVLDKHIVELKIDMAEVKTAKGKRNNRIKTVCVPARSWPEGTSGPQCDC